MKHNKLEHTFPSDYSDNLFLGVTISEKYVPTFPSLKFNSLLM